MRRCRVFFLKLLFLITSWNSLIPIEGFSRSSKSWKKNQVIVHGLQMGMWDDIGKFFSFHNDENKNNNIEPDGGNELTPGNLRSSRLLSLQVKAIKPGGLRLFLMFYLLGIQNNPEKGTWRIDQPSTDEYIVHLYFQDKTAGLMIVLGETQVSIDRIGSKPSMMYMLQETVVIDGILEELQRLATDNEVKQDDRLILMKDEQAITSAREELSFG
jgi:hypothetical protein